MIFLLKCLFLYLFSLEQWFSDLNMHQNPPEGSTPESVVQPIWGSTQEFAFFSSFPGMLLLLVWGLPCENHCAGIVPGPDSEPECQEELLEQLNVDSPR